LSFYDWSKKIETPIVIDSGAPKSINPELSDFVGKILPMNAHIQAYLQTKFKQVGSVKWHIRDSLDSGLSEMAYSGLTRHAHITFHKLLYDYLVHKNNFQKIKQVLFL